MPKPTYEELEKRFAELKKSAGAPDINTTLLDIFRCIPSCKTFEEAARKIFDQCKQLTGAQSGYVALLSANGKENEVLFLDDGGAPCTVDPTLPMPIRGLRETAYRTNKAACENAFPESSWMDFMPEGHLRLENVMFVPLNIEGVTVGIIGLANKPGGFTSQDIGIAEMLGDLAAVALTFARSQDSLKESGELYRSILETTMDGFWVTDIEGRLLEVNDAYCQMSGYTKNELTAMKISDLEAQEDASKVTRHIEKLASMGSDRFESRHRKKDGGIMDIEVSVQFRPEQGGRVVCFLRDISERKKTEAALVESEQKWRNILTNTPQIGVTLNPEAKIVFVNDHLLKLTGWNEHEVIGKDWFDLFIPENVRDVIRKVFFSAMNQKDAFGYSTYENEILDRRGNTLNVAWSNVLTKDADGKSIDITCLGVDLTERIRAEKALSDSAAYMQSIFRAAPSGIGVVTNRVFSKVNDTLCRMVGYSREELIGQGPALIYPSQEECDRVGRVKFEQIQKRGTGSVETRFRRKDGGIVDVLLSATPIDPSDHGVGLTFTALDISERKKIERSVQVAHELLLTILDSIDATISVADMKTYEILFMNKYMVESFGRDLTGELCWQAFRGGSGPCSFCSNSRLLDDHGQPTGLYSWQGKNPITEKWYINHDRAIQWTDGRMVRLQIATDITQIKDLEEKLRQSQKMESIGNLAGGIAHDFNNILFPIMGLSEMLMDDLPKNSQERESAEEIFKAGKRGSDLVKQILAFSRQSEQKKVPTRIQSILKEVLKLSRSTIPAYIEINQAIQSDCGMVLADPSQMHQVGMNIITNAYHAVEDKGGTITVRLEERNLEEAEAGKYDLRPGRYLVLSVNDTGCGMPEKLVDKIFDPYFTTKEQGKGTGLGLAVVYGIVKEHSGTVKVHSAVGKGSTFDVYLPLMEKAGLAEPVKTMADLPTGHERIFLVDDEEAIANLEKMMLTRLGYTVASYTSSVKALEAFEADPHAYDLVVTDMTMPSLTGAQLAGKVRSLRKSMPIIICTGFSEKMDEAKAKDLGVAGLLMKPIDRADLAKTVRRVLDEFKGGAPPE
ncbi:multi-sensor hybrid histidine kinase [Desulfatibacillum aliphaticivorans]|uniref:histidine kinase n=1 Tax=Desulfatibacillum aliphaticivorans TaxID=218208 RepID=B8FND1_DESAL|nr:PAS domain S-box protein [Desulfatibacillum aliphaticivorans]ACL06100.1 multi-sensor hybrid histidine kinase [Desulfatibacillum aliphaticivorans]